MEKAVDDGRLIPLRYRVVSGSVLKVIAVLTMFVDHAALMLPAQVANTLLFTLPGHPITIYLLMRYIGRVSFPIFCFLLTEGFVHTHDRKAYGTRLAIFALISEFPWNLWHADKLIWFEKQNVFVTLFLAYCELCLLDFARESNDTKQRKRALALMIGLFIVTALVRCDYGVKGVGCVLALYLFREMPVPRFLVGTACLNNPIPSSVAFLPISMYNGKRGFISGRTLQMLFYLIYPAHMLVLWYIKLRVYEY